jgi:ribosomal-protein-alanine N-acetyltransferase
MTIVSSLNLRPMTETDVELVTVLEEQAYSQPWNAKVFAEELRQPSRTYLIIEDDRAVLGYAGLMVVGNEAHVTTVVVHPDRRDDKLGTRLMLGLAAEAIEQGARSMTLEVRASNEPAQRLYRRFGMAPVGVRKRYYQDEDAMIMWVHDIDGVEFATRVAKIQESLR